jgi:hypothetical protein
VDSNGSFTAMHKSDFGSCLFGNGVAPTFIQWSGPAIGSSGWRFDIRVVSGHESAESARPRILSWFHPGASLAVDCGPRIEYLAGCLDLFEFAWLK